MLLKVFHSVFNLSEVDIVQNSAFPRGSGAGHSEWIRCEMGFTQAAFLIDTLFCLSPGMEKNALKD